MIRLTESDLWFLVETVATRRKDYDHIMRLVQDKEDILDQMLENPLLSERLLRNQEEVVRISPAMLFSILLRRLRRDLAVETFVYEIGAHGQRIPVFEAPQVLKLLSQPEVLDYLASMLGSFARTHSGTIYWKEEGRWHKRRFSDMDLDDLLALCRLVAGSQRATLYKRMADVALFLSGIFPDHTSLFVAPPRRAFACRRTLMDYETQGKRFYQLAAQQQAKANLRMACQILSEQFTLARRALNTLSDRFLRFLSARPLGELNN